MNRIFLKGLTTGLALQLAIGPVFFFIINLLFQYSLANALSAVFAVVIVDYIYITFAILGVGKLLEQEKIKKNLTLISGVVLVLFGVYIIQGSMQATDFSNKVGSDTQTLMNSFIAAFILTISSPLTIVFWTSVFAAKSLEFALTKRETYIFGLSAGVATLLFLTITVLIFSIFKSSIPIIFVKVANISVGLLLVVYGISRLLKSRKVANDDVL
jgi:threonine/homoserine/homoserine lactone efflux protein